MPLRLPSAKSSTVKSHLMVMPGWGENDYVTSTWNHCAEEMNVNAGHRLSPTCLEPAFAYSWSFFLIWLSASESAKSLGCISSSCSKRFWGIRKRSLAVSNLLYCFVSFFTLNLPRAILFPQSVLQTLSTSHSYYHGLVQAFHFLLELLP